MRSFIKFVQQKTPAAILIIFIVGVLTGIIGSKIASGQNMSQNALAVMSPKTDEAVSGIVPIRGYFKTQEDTFFLTADLKIDDEKSQFLQVVRVNEQEVAVIGSWDATKDPGKHEITISLYKTSKQGDKTPIAQTKLPISVLLFQ